MLQKKREKFLKQIRRKQIDQLFKQRREELLQNPTFHQIYESFQFNQTANNISSSLDCVKINLKSGNIQEALLGLDHMIDIVKDKKRQASAFLLLLVDKFKHLITNIIKNQQKMDERNEWIKLSPQLQHQLLQKILYILSSISYKQVNQQQYFGLLTAFWSIFSCDQICLFAKESQTIIDLVLATIKTMLIGRNQFVLRDLKSIGLGSQLAKIISYQIKTLTERQQIELIQIIQYYIQQQIHFGEVTSNSINGVYILGFQSNQKQVLLAYCLYLIHNRRQKTYLSAIRTLILIFQKHEYLSSSIQQKSIKQISQIINYPNRNIQVKALELLDDIIYYNYQSGYRLLDKMYLPDLLYEKLQRQVKIRDDYTNQVVERCTNILCNLTLGKFDRPTKNLFQFHPIWELAYQNIVQSSPLYPLVAVFEYYFQLVPRKNVLKILESYISSVGQLDTQNISKSSYQAIKRTIIRVYHQAKDFWPEGYEQDHFLELIRDNGLTSIIQQVMDIEPQANCL